MNKNYITTVEGCNGLKGFDRDLLLHFFEVKETEDAKRNKPQRKTQHDEWRGFSCSTVCLRMA